MALVGHTCDRTVNITDLRVTVQLACRSVLLSYYLGFFIDNYNLMCAQM